jgi:ribosomal protein S18 acetylase RimI-like enzyme
VEVDAGPAEKPVAVLGRAGHSAFVTISIRSFAVEDVDDVVAFSLRAWKPVFESFEQVLGSRIYRRLYPDWIASQARAVEAVCRDESSHVGVAELDARVVGFVAVVFHDDPKRGEIEMLAVDPDSQGQGVGSALTSFALEQIRAAGVALAEVGTGGDPGHAPARRTYEKAGFTPLPLVRYYQAL